MTLIFSLLFNLTAYYLLPTTARAATSPWIQTDWSGGSGQTSWSDITKYSSGSTIDTTTTGQVTLSLAEKLTNTGFDSNNTSWSVAAVPASGWVEVPGNATYSTTNFLAMQYEAKYNCTGDGDGDTAAACSAPADSGLGLDYRDISSFATSKVVSTANGAPIVHITHTQAVSACPSGYHLINNNEWMSIARNAEAQSSNWANGTVGSLVSAGGGLKRGNVGIVDSASYDGTDPEYGTGRNSKAMLTMSNGSQIWDISGNIWEHVKRNTADDLIQGKDQPTGSTPGFNWREFTALTTYGTLTYDLVRPLSTSYDATYGVGRIYSDGTASNTNSYVFLRVGIGILVPARGHSLSP